MKLCRLVSELGEHSGIVGFVPTMGALHSGHIALVERARAECDVVVVSIFVNPTQFNDPRDLQNYPRTEQADLELLSAAGADMVFAPSVSEVYPTPDTRRFDFGALESVMEGAHRPGHFNGVAQVVSRLFEIVRPSRAYFGEKDFQQLAIIRRMCADMALPVEIVGCPIVRGYDGLALSSRNALLTPEKRTAAPLINRALRCAADKRGMLPIEDFKRLIVSTINSNEHLRTEYFEVVDAQTLQPISDWGSDSQHPLRGCVAVFAGDVRLIDNIAL